MQSRISICASIRRLGAVACAALIALSLAACEAGDSAREATAPEERAATDLPANGASPSSAEPRRRARPGELSAVRDRADAAFAAMDERPARGASRIGPQPWPNDLPADWPRLEEGRVVADTRRDEGRLLLVDWPDAIDPAVRRFDDALRAQGYSVQAGRRGSTPMLHVTTTRKHAELTFFERESGTRVEILFRDRVAG